MDEPVSDGLRQAALAATAASDGDRALLPWHTRIALAAMLAGGIAIGWGGRGAVPPDATVSSAETLARAAVIAHAVYAPEIPHSTELAAIDRGPLGDWLSRRLDRTVVVPDLAGVGHELVGGRLLPGDPGAVAQFMYQDASGRRLTLYVRPEPTDAPATALRFAEQGAVRVIHWVDGALAYALSGEFTRDELQSLATRVRRQIAS